MAVSGTGSLCEISFGISAKVYARLEALAKERNLRPAGYAQYLFEAAYASVVGIQPNPALEAQITRTVLLAGDGTCTALIADIVGLKPATVARILDAWRAETGKALEAA